MHELASKQNSTQSEKKLVKEYRQLRMKKYLDKKSKRNFDKKIVYDTRKKVADKRIRFQGKFINEEQARELLGIGGGEFSFEELRSMMNKIKKS
jgi:hypothetical protein